jgi:type IV pilus assembly protein PilE
MCMSIFRGINRHGKGRGYSLLGFTLIELMITLAIISILVAIAFPAYNEIINKGKRTEAKAMAQEAAQWMERFYAENYSYEKNTKNVDVADIFSVRFTQSPKPPAGAAYTVELKGLSANTFTVLMKRANSMLGDKCGNFGLKYNADKIAENFGSQYPSSAAAVADCWN